MACAREPAPDNVGIRRSASDAVDTQDTTSDAARDSPRQNMQRAGTGTTATPPPRSAAVLFGTTATAGSHCNLYGKWNRASLRPVGAPLFFRIIGLVDSSCATPQPTPHVANGLYLERQSIRRRPAREGTTTSIRGWRCDGSPMHHGWSVQNGFEVCAVGVGHAAPVSACDTNALDPAFQ